jgi:hypothetical protein
MSYVLNSAGLGQSASDEAAQCVALGYASYLFNPSCWGQSYADWQAQFYGPNTINIATPVAPAAPATALTDPNAVLADTTGDTSQDLSNAAILATQGANAAENPPTADACQTLSNNWPYPFGNMDCPTMLGYGIAAVAIILLLPRLFK